MKRYSIIFLTLSLLAASCSKDREYVHGEGRASVVIDIDRADLVFTTKAGEEEEKELQTLSEKTVKSLCMAIYDASDELEWSKAYPNAFITAKSVTGLTEGRKTVVIIANRDDIKFPQNLRDVEFYRSTLSSNEGGFLMYGREVCVASSSPDLTKVQLRRVAAMLYLHQAIRVAWDGDAPASGEFDLKAIYAANVAQDCDLAGGGRTMELLNPREDESLITEDAFLRRCTYAKKEYWSSGFGFNEGLSFYVYPNRDPEHRTAVIIKAVYKGEDCYYALPIDMDIEPNMAYVFGMITITCKGMPTPAEAFAKVKTVADYKACDWTVKKLFPEYEF